jgi:hypothetical protein
MTNSLKEIGMQENNIIKKKLLLNIKNLIFYLNLFGFRLNF